MRGEVLMLEARELRKVYNGYEALKGLDISVAAGEIYCLLGANGAGKTTTINLFLNFIDPTSGSAKVDGLSVVDHPIETKQRLAYIPETVMLYGSLTGFENLSYFAKLGGHNEYSRADLLGFLDRVGLQSEAAHKRVSTYSKGMRQKVGVAIALAKKAKALLLDEPTSGLDPRASNEFSELLRQFQADGAAILMATHDLFRAKETGTRIGIMRGGALVREMATNEVSHADIERIYLEHMQ